MAGAYPNQVFSSWKADRDSIKVHSKGCYFFFSDQPISQLFTSRRKIHLGFLLQNLARSQMICENKDFSQQSISLHFGKKTVLQGLNIKRKHAKSRRDTIKNRFTLGKSYNHPWENTIKRAPMWFLLGFSLLTVL